MLSTGKYIAIAVLLLTIIMAPCSACAGYIVGSGPMVTKDYNFSDFSSVQIGGFIGGLDADISQSDTYAVSIAMPENLVPYIEVSQFGGTLKITTNGIVTGSQSPKVSIKMPDLRGINYSGGSRGKVSGFKSSHDMSILCSGGGNVNLDIEARSTDINLSGGGTLTGRIVFTDARITVAGGSTMDLTGSGSGTARLNSSGGSQVHLSGLTARNADVMLSGGSGADISVSDKLAVNLSGGSGLHYKGSPEITAKIITGYSELTHD
jgi:hypothetical protein